MDRRVEQVHTDEREIRRRILRLLDETHDVSVARHLGDAELARIVDVTQEDLCDRRLCTARPARGGELGDEPLESLFEHVVAEVHDEFVVAEELLGDEHTMGESERGVLRDVRHTHAEL